MPTTISVIGSAEARHPAERGTVRIVIAIEGGDRRTVTDAGAHRSAELLGGVRALHDEVAGPVTEFSSEQLRVSAERPWNSEGKQLPFVYRSASSLSVQFDDFTRLSEWVTESIQLDGVTVAGIVWTLTDQRRSEMTADVEDRAVRDAVARAERYAASLGLGALHPITVSDPGLLDGAAPSPEHRTAAPRMMSAGLGSDTLEFAPQDIVVAATVHARFSAS